MKILTLILASALTLAAQTKPAGIAIGLVFVSSDGSVQPVTLDDGLILFQPPGSNPTVRAMSTFKVSRDGSVTISNSAPGSQSPVVTHGAPIAPPPSIPQAPVVDLPHIPDSVPPPPVVKPAAPSAYADPATVLVIVQDNTGPEAGTGGKNASQYVADYYMQKRGIPAENLLHISTMITNGQGVSCKPGGLDCLIGDGASTNIPYSAYTAGVRDPVIAKLSALKGRIKYIVPVYGVPITIQALGGSEHLSLDSFLAASQLPTSDTPIRLNPYYDRDPASTPAHIDSSASQVLLVSRLDGESALAAAALVDKAIFSESNVVTGNGYFDYQGLGTLANKASGYPYQFDYSMMHASGLCKDLAPSVNCILNDQSGGKGMIQSAPDTAFAWGWYNLSTADVYIFKPGAVGAQLTSNSGNCVRGPCPGGWVALWLKRGITATWGATYEPYADYFALGDNLLGHLWRGYTFGESAYISSPMLQWMMIFVGDPLYRPRMR